MYITITKAIESTELLFIMPHWNFEFGEYSCPFDRWIARSLFDSDADEVVGLHPHVSKGIEVINSK